ncbi:putative transporter small subunit [Ramlibacter tataouinensis]|nr:putative transporter small subunit [Ramlibacter tataouinensis]WBY02400.1 putative transporter small subunit [Ramlibacter tataouinensis]
MDTFWITAYILVWPVIAAGVLAVLVVSIGRDFLVARRTGTEIV